MVVDLLFKELGRDEGFQNKPAPEVDASDPVLAVITKALVQGWCVAVAAGRVVKGVSVAWGARGRYTVLVVV